MKTQTQSRIAMPLKKTRSTVRLTGLCVGSWADVGTKMESVAMSFSVCKVGCCGAAGDGFTGMRGRYHAMGAFHKSISEEDAHKRNSAVIVGLMLA
jgi:hypothetical protein